jgi:cell wall assembly regulator SMI1
MAIEFERDLLPASPDAIARIEQRFGARLPDDYRAFLLQRNGGYAPGSGFDDDVSIRYFFSAGPNDDPYLEDIEEAAGSYFEDDELELRDGFVPIGEDDGGNLVLLHVNPGDDYGAVWFWGHDIPGDDAYERVTDSFAAFFAALRQD